jgi:hypothetical protein
MHASEATYKTSCSPRGGIRPGPVWLTVVRHAHHDAASLAPGLDIGVRFGHPGEIIAPVDDRPTARRGLFDVREFDGPDPPQRR